MESVRASSITERWRRVESVFHDALGLDEERRPAFLEEACGTDAELRREVESLLAAAAAPDQILEGAVSRAASDLVNAPSGLPPGTRLDHYEIIEKIGSGGMGQVYLAEDLHLRRRVAIKVLPPELTRDSAALKRLRGEAQAASALNHPNILTIYEFTEFENRQFIVMELVEGRTLRQLLAEGSFSLNEGVDIGIQIASALSAAHASGIVHRDIKPENVIVRSDRVVKSSQFPSADHARKGGLAIRNRKVERYAFAGAPLPLLYRPAMEPA